MRENIELIIRVRMENFFFHIETGEKDQLSIRIRIEKKNFSKLTWERKMTYQFEFELKKKFFKFLFPVIFEVLLCFR